VKVTRTALPEVLLIDLDVYTDERGHFFERYNEERFRKHGLPTNFCQDNSSRSRRGVLRGLHYQLLRPQGKLVGCTRGEAFDVAVDIRVGSPTFGQWVGFTLSEQTPQVMWIPPGFAHGFCALSDVVDIEYKCTELYDAADDRGVLWSDPELRIGWPLPQPLVSKRDRELPLLRAAELPVFAGQLNHEVVG
jgi:dTDP-4-dehydrorhamnose 3,5-epimerase